MPKVSVHLQFAVKLVTGGGRHEHIHDRQVIVDRRHDE